MHGSKDTNLIKINFLKKKFKKYLIGLSDHTNDIFSSVASIPLGVVAIEKHFINNKNILIKRIILIIQQIQDFY